jgi:hypothetical protein
MVTRDLIEREIEKIGLALRKLFGLLEDLKQENKFPEATAAAQVKLKELFSIDSSDLLEEPLDQFKDRLDKYKGEYVRELGNLLFEMADIEWLNGNKNEALTIAGKAEISFLLAEKKSGMVHLEIVKKFEKITWWRGSYL